jgi:signal transduction histidine kinase
MKLKSLRLQLPFSYAAIALLATLVLGLVLLLTLRRYYQDQELKYLVENGRAMSYAVARMVESGLPAGVLDAQIENLSFLTLARIRVFDMEGALIVDSGVPDAIQIASLSGQGGPTQFFVSSALDPNAIPVLDAKYPEGELPNTGVIFVNGDFPKDGSVPIPFEKMVSSMKGAETIGKQDVIGFVAPLGQSLYGFNLSSPAMDIERSNQVADIPLVNPEGEKIGSLQLSDGPAYGTEIVVSVAQSWVVAGLLAVILAAGAGWLVSRQMVAPVLALTSATSQMAGGNLSVRAEIAAPEELATLGRSFNEMAARVETTVSALRSFVTDAAHQFHTPLTALRTNLELAAAKSGASQRETFVASALQQAERLGSLVDSLLDLSRIEAGGSAQVETQVDLGSLARQASELYASQAEQKGVTFTIELPEADLLVQGDREQLLSVLANLLDNAVKFTPSGGTIRLAIKQETPWVVIQVADSGISIPPDDLPDLFRRFHRGRNVSGYPGSGLGLAIVKAIVERHAGQVDVQGVPDGAQFTVRLPLFTMVKPG